MTETECNERFKVTQELDVEYTNADDLSGYCSSRVYPQKTTTGQPIAPPTKRTTANTRPERRVAAGAGKRGRRGPEKQEVGDGPDHVGNWGEVTG